MRMPTLPSQARATSRRDAQSWAPRFNGTLYAARGSVRPTPLPPGAEVEPRRARALKTLVRPAAPSLGAEMPADRTCATGRHWMTKAARTTPPSRAAALCGIRGTCKACNAESECSPQNQIFQHRYSSDLSFSKEKRAAYDVNPTERHVNATLSLGHGRKQKAPRGRPERTSRLTNFTQPIDCKDLAFPNREKLINFKVYPGLSHGRCPRNSEQATRSQICNLHNHANRLPSPGD